VKFAVSQEIYYKFVSAANAHVLQTPMTTPMTAAYTVACHGLDAVEHM
jgi:hypothetical protein